MSAPSLWPAALPRRTRTLRVPSCRSCPSSTPGPARWGSLRMSRDASLHTAPHRAVAVSLTTESGVRWCPFRCNTGDAREDRKCISFVYHGIHLGWNGWQTYHVSLQRMVSSEARPSVSQRRAAGGCFQTVSNQQQQMQRQTADLSTEAKLRIPAHREAASRHANERLQTRLEQHAQRRQSPPESDNRTQRLLRGRMTRGG
jgi:hypothetical protein